MRTLLLLLCAACAAVELVPRPETPADDTSDASSDVSEPPAPPPASDVAWRFGRATFYGDAPGDDLAAGACGYGPSLGGSSYGADAVAAVADASPELNGGPSNGATSPCGRCFELRCVPSLVPADGGTLPRCGAACRRDAQPLRVRVTDACPCLYAANEASNKRWCCGDTPHFDLSAAAFDKLATSRQAGVLGVAFRRVPCAPAGNVTLRVASAFAGAKAELVVLDAAGSGGVSLLEARSSAEAPWTPLARGWGATWQLTWPQAGPVSVRVTAEDGALITLADVITGPGALRAGAELATGVQFEALPQPPPPQRGWPGPDEELAPLLPCPLGAGALAAAAHAAAGLFSAATGGAQQQPCAQTAMPSEQQVLPAWCRLVPAAMPVQLRPAGCVAAAAAALAAQTCGGH